MGESITVRSILSGTVSSVIANFQVVALYLAVFVAGGTISDVLAASQSEEFAIAGAVLALLFVLASIVGGYLLMEAMLRRAGNLREAATRRFLGYFGQAILITLGIAAGLALLIVPGVIFAARWVLAAPLFVGGGEGAVDAISKSWRLTKGHTLKIILAGLPLVILLIIVVAAAAVAAGNEGVAAIIIENFAANGLTVLMTAMAVALFGMISPPTGEISEVFA